MVSVIIVPKHQPGDDLVLLHCDEVVVVTSGLSILEVVVVLVDLDAATVHDRRGPQVGDSPEGRRGVQGIVAGVEIFDPVIGGR